MILVLREARRAKERQVYDNRDDGEDNIPFQEVMSQLVSPQDEGLTCLETKSPGTSRRFISFITEGRSKAGWPTRQCCPGVERIRAGGPAEAFLLLATAYRSGARRE